MEGAVPALHSGGVAAAAAGHPPRVADQPPGAGRQAAGGQE